MGKTVTFLLCLTILLSCHTGVNERKSITDLESFQLKTLFVDLNNNPVDITQYKGKRIVLNYWATWCGPCIKEMPALKITEDLLENHNYAFLLVSDETISKISDFKMNKKFDFNYLKSVKSIETLGIYSLPTSYIFDENGKKIETIVGTISWDSEEIIEKLKKI
ncbi:MAG: TlpA family protein disulfide reductase [Flavobacteriaceae bacterium]